MIKKREVVNHMNEHRCEIIDRVKSGDENAFEELYREFYKLAYYFAFKLCHNEADAKDAVQDTFIEIHRSISTLKENSYFKAWMYKIVHSKCKKIFRKNKYVTTDFENEPVIGTIAEERREFTPEQFVHFTSDQEALQSCLDQLPDSQRAIIILFYLEQMSIKEIADILEIPTGTVKSRLSYGRNYLKQALDEYEQMHGQAIDFHQLDVMIAALLAKELAEEVIGVPLFSVKKQHISHKISHTVGAKVIIGALSVLLIGSGVYLFLDDDESPQSTIQENDSHQRHFSEQTVGNEVIDNAQDAYFTLIEWACCEEMIREKSENEIAEVYSLYNELKLFGGLYYEQLVDRNWAAAYEARLSK